MEASTHRKPDLSETGGAAAAFPAMTRLLLPPVLVACALPAAASAEPPANDTRGAAGDRRPSRPRAGDDRGRGDRGSPSPGQAAIRLDELRLLLVPRRGRRPRAVLACTPTATSTPRSTSTAAPARSSSRWRAGRPTSRATAVGLNVKDGETYLVRIAQRANSVVRDLHAAARPRHGTRPAAGAPLPAGGRRDSVDSVLNPSDAWNVELAWRGHLPHQPRSRSEGRHGCVSAVGLPAGDALVRHRRPRARAQGCGGYVLLTPRPDLAGRWILRVEAVNGTGNLPYSLEAAPAGDRRHGARHLRPQRPVALGRRPRAADRRRRPLPVRRKPPLHPRPLLRTKAPPESDPDRLARQARRVRLHR